MNLKIWVVSVFILVGYTQLVATTTEKTVFDVRDEIENDMSQGMTTRAYNKGLKACVQDNLYACELVSDLLRGGYSIPADLSKAKIFMKKACNGGVGTICEAQKLTLNKEESRLLEKEYEKKCSDGSPKYCEALGIKKYYGLGIKEDRTEGMTLLIKSCSLGYARACTEVSGLYIVGKEGMDMTEKSFEYLDLACFAGDNAQCYKLGQKKTALSARGGSKEGVEYFKQACFGGFGKACIDLAKMTSLGWGTKKDPVLAEELIQRACDLGEEKACLVKSTNVVEVEKGVNALRSKCEAGQSKSCADLVIYLEKEVKENEKRLKWFAIMSCEHGNGAECELLGKRYINGDFGLKDKKKAEAAYKSGCYKGDTKSCEALVDPIKVFSKSCEKGTKVDCQFLEKYYLTGKMGFGGNTVRKVEKIDMERGLKLASNLCISGGLDACDDIKEWNFDKWQEVEKIMALQELYENSKQLGLQDMLVDIVYNPRISLTEPKTMVGIDSAVEAVGDLFQRASIVVENVVFGDEGDDLTRAVENNISMSKDLNIVQMGTSPKKPFIERYITETSHKSIIIGLLIMLLVSVGLLVYRRIKRKN